MTVEYASVRTTVSGRRAARMPGMAADIFAKLGDIKGESLDAKHKDEIEVLSFSWGLTNSASSSSSSGGGGGKATFQDLTIVHNIDKASRVSCRRAPRERISRTRPSRTASLVRASRNT